MKNRIKAEIIRAGLTRWDVARVLGITAVSLSRKINGHTEFTAGELLKLSEKFGVTVDYLVKGGEYHGKTDS